ncbi:MAG: protein-export chaperone SecB [Thioalkalispiraceae bacterium]
MSDSKQKQAAENKQGASGQQFNIQKVYTKDISFESPNTPKIFTEKWEPQNNLDLNTNASPIGENTYEVMLSLTVTTKVGETTAYLCEVHQAGIFYIDGFSEQDLHAMLGSFCPNILFPYAREAVSDIVTRGGFPQLLLAPINFDALYEQHLQQQANAEQPETVN